ncbi:pentapeptide repeat-containing protein [Nocardia huaxiensis]|uniref:Pentapeptide repeat-containing protein n=1 Tax=Nocardia huaxiensis TaxID=2755382 RepID=A0A7D6VDM2_9NOCA|nr:pentapeptide repeat-containing protein [Nocardia huaxiensis]QLY33981.1 pentapeptide repeat-containing protein [Nocardia huaxiensis]
MVTTIAALAALWFTNQSLRATSDQAGLARQTAITDRFAKAIEQLGDEKLDVRLGGIYLLERLASDSPNDRTSIVEVLSAFVRTHAPNGRECGVNPQDEPPTDVQAVLTVIGRRDPDRTEFVDLSNTCLANAELEGANLVGAELSKANLTKAVLDRANLAGATMRYVALKESHLIETNLASAHLDHANLQGSYLMWANLRNAILATADLRHSFLLDATMEGTTLMWADARGAKFSEPTGASSGFESVGPDGGSPVEQRTAKGAFYRDCNFSEVRFDEWTRWPVDFRP